MSSTKGHHTLQLTVLLLYYFEYYINTTVYVPLYLVVNIGDGGKRHVVRCQSDMGVPYDDRTASAANRKETRQRAELHACFGCSSPLVNPGALK